MDFGQKKLVHAQRVPKRNFVQNFVCVTNFHILGVYTGTGAHLNALYQFIRLVRFIECK